MTNEVTFFSSLTDKEPKLVSWEHVATMIRSTQLQKQCDDYRSLLSIYQQATDKGDKQMVRQLKSQLAHIKHQLPAFMPQAMVEGGKAAENITRLMPFMIVDLDHIPDDLMATTEKMVKNCELSLIHI